MEKLKLKLLFVCALVFLMGAGQVLGDWDPGDHHKMHYPQLPKPGGWDVAFNFGRLADDWQCSETGPVTDIHFWVSWEQDKVSTIGGFSVRIWSDDPCGPNGYSEPNELLWERDYDAGQFTVRDMPDDLQGWFDPFSGSGSPDDHIMWQQINIVDISDPWIQKEGEIYWLEIDMWGASNCGWKESGSPHFRDDAVAWDSPSWMELRDPTTGDSLDLAFVITGEEDVKNKNLKWSQPPIEWDPMVDPPRYCGWDELSLRNWIQTFWLDCWNCRTQCHGDADCDGYVDNDDLVILMAAFGGIWPNLPYDECADFNRDLIVGPADLLILQANWLSYPPEDCSLRPQSWQMAADDFRCLGSMPATSLHWWGSHQGWEEAGAAPPDLPIAWRIGFWSNISATPRCDFLYGAATGTTSGNNPSSLYKIDPTTGAATLIGPIGFNGVTGLSFAPDGTLYASANGDNLYADGFGHAILLTIDTTTGAGTFVGEISNNDPTTDPNGAGRMPDISFNSLGVLYGYADQCNAGDSLWTINTGTGAGTFIGPTGYGGGGNGMDFAPGGTLYATPYDNQSLVIINPATGVGFDVAGTIGNVPQRVNALEFCPQSGVLYGSWNDGWNSGNNYLVTLDLTTGLPTVIGQTVQGLDAITFNTFSHPGELLWQIEVPEDRVEVEEVGYDEYPEIPFYDICYQYYLDLEPEEWFWQPSYHNYTMDNIYWLSIAAIYEPNLMSIQYPWGWKTRPWSWMDDGVRFWMDENPEPDMVLDPDRNMIEPIEDPVFHESFDLAFEINTDPNWIKWEQPFTGIRNWPHYEDEMSMATEVTIVEPNVTKYVQHPDLSPNGVDVDATTIDDGVWSAQSLADDFNCTTTGPITDIHIWGSWYHDYPFPEDLDFQLSIYSDNPVGPSGWSEPNEWLWSQDFAAGDYDVSIEARDLNEGYYVPCVVPPFYEPNADTICYKYDFYIDPHDAFIQNGDPCNPVVYWLVVEAYTLQPTGPMAEQEYPIRFGWKTSTDHWNDDAVWRVPGSNWNELRYPAGHPYAGNSIDLAFEITTEEKWTELQIDRLVADDWPCEYNEPVTATVWWGSYIGYEYAACDIQGPWMALPVPPKYFLLNIWTDVPADSTDPMSYSHPNDILWKYKAYDYDEVLVGYDKHPEEPDPNGGGHHEPVFRYSVRLPEEDWFYQEEPNNVYWFSVVAVYDDDPNASNYDWGWTNHRHVYNDDAVEGYLDPGGPEPIWSWYELYDQTEMSEDMSFILFTEPECPCWGDIVGSTSPAPDNRVNTADLAALMGLLGPYGPPFDIGSVPPGYECMDIAGSTSPVPDNNLNTADLAALMGYLGPFGPPFDGPCMPPP